MRIFSRGRKREHQAGVVYVYERKSHAPSFYGAVCNCGWFTEVVEAGYPDPAVEEQMASAARAHDPEADISVAFPMDEPSEI
ncbi:MAG TPA: hypothetical protein VHT26_16920 [Trebonia sp.]|jgi:hypothetical protein|nr:hypothetical protein [Trebonia sp.]